jgi:hypothetical protein
MCCTKPWNKEMLPHDKRLQRSRTPQQSWRWMVRGVKFYQGQMDVTMLPLSSLQTHFILWKPQNAVATVKHCVACLVWNVVQGSSLHRPENWLVRQLVDLWAKASSTWSRIYQRERKGCSWSSTEEPRNRWLPAQVKTGAFYGCFYLWVRVSIS